MLTGADVSALLLDQKPIGFDVVNAHGDGIVYIANDERWGQLTLRMQNNTDASVTLGAASSLLKLYLWPLLTSEEIGKITLGTPGWKLGRVSEQQQIHLEIGPAGPLTVEPGERISIQIEGVLASGVATAGRFLVQYSGLGNLKNGEQRIPVMRQLPPDQGKTWPLTLGFRSRAEYGGSSDQGNAIYVTPWQTDASIDNNFVIEIVADQTVPFAGQTPTIIISFLSGDSDASLCSDAEIEIMIAGIDQSPGDDPWVVTKDTTTPLPVFNARPKSGTEAFDTAGPLGIKFSNLASTLPSGKASLVFVQCTGLDTYDDYVGVHNLDKLDPVPVVNSFAAYDGSDVVAQDGTVDYGQVTLKWDVFAAQQCLVKESRFVGKAYDSMLVPANRSQMAYTLIPLIGTKQFTKEPGLVQFNVAAPKVGPCAVSPATVPPGGASTLSWSCSNADHVQVKRSDGTVLVDGAGLVSSCSVNAGTSDTTFTVTAVGAGETSSSVTLDVPAPDPLISAQIVAYHAGHGEGSRTFLSLVVSWNAQYAVSCSVWRLDTGALISTSLVSDWSPLDGTMPHNFRITAVGNGTTTKDASW